MRVSDDDSYDNRCDESTSQGLNCGPKPLVLDPEDGEQIEHAPATSPRIQDLGVNVVSPMYERATQGGETYQGDDSTIKASVVTDTQPINNK